MAVKAPPYLLRLRVNNFRSLRDVDIQLGKLNVLVGPNGAGKSNLLDVIAFLRDSVSEDLEPALNRRGGVDHVRFRGEKTSEGARVTVFVEAAVTRHSSNRATDQYTLSFSKIRATNRRREFLRRTEDFMFKRTAGRGRRITIRGGDISFISFQESADDSVTTTGRMRPTSLGLSTLPRLGPAEGGEQVDDLAELFASFRVFDVDVNAARRPSSSVADSELEDDASNLAAFLQHMYITDEERFLRLEEDAATVIPGFHSLEFEKIGGATEGTVLKVRENGLRGLTELADMSYGSIRALALLAVLHDPHPPKLTCIEEIDHGLHPYVLDRLVELLREAATRTQLLIATHSPPLVNRLRADELIVCERREDSSSAIPAVAPEVVRAMESELDGELGLGELWFTGALGGVPE